MHRRQLPIDREYLDDGYSSGRKNKSDVSPGKDGNSEYFYVLVWLRLSVFN